MRSSSSHPGRMILIWWIFAAVLATTPLSRTVLGAAVLSDASEIDVCQVEEMIESYSSQGEPVSLCYYPVFPVQPYDYQVDLPKPASSEHAFNPYFGLLAEEELIYFTENFAQSFQLIYPGLAQVPIHQHDITGLLVFGYFYLVATDEAGYQPGRFIDLLTDLHAYFDSSSKMLSDMLRISETHYLSRTGAFEMLFELAFEGNCVYTVEAFFASGSISFSKDVFGMSMKICETLGDFRLSNRIATALSDSDQFEVVTTLAAHKSWPSLSNIGRDSKVLYLGTQQYRSCVSSVIEIPDFHDRSQPFTLNVEKTLGHGAYGTSFMVNSASTGKKYCMKVVSKRQLVEKEDRWVRMKREIAMQASLSHVNIARLYCAFDDECNVHLLMELCEGQDLLRLIDEKKRFSEAEVKPILHQLVLGLQYLHNHHIVHRDLKLENIMVHSGNVIKIVDFGLSAFLKDEKDRLDGFCGTLRYLAPEVLNLESYGFEVDIWALGVVLFALLEGKYPFDSNSDTKLKEDDHSVHGRLLIDAILKLDPKQRASLQAISSHQFLMNES